MKRRKGPSTTSSIGSVGWRTSQVTTHNCNNYDDDDIYKEERNKGGKKGKKALALALA